MSGCQHTTKGITLASNGCMVFLYGQKSTIKHRGSDLAWTFGLRNRSYTVIWFMKFDRMHRPSTSQIRERAGSHTETCGPEKLLSGQSVHLIFTCFSIPTCQVHFIVFYCILLRRHFIALNLVKQPPFSSVSTWGGQITCTDAGLHPLHWANSSLAPWVEEWCQRWSISCSKRSSSNIQPFLRGRGISADATGHGDGDSPCSKIFRF